MGKISIFFICFIMPLISYAETINGSWAGSGGRNETSSKNPSHQFVTQQSGNVTIRLDTSSNNDAYLYLLDENDQIVSSDDDSGDDRDSFISIWLESGRTYKVVAATYNMGIHGNYTLTINGAITITLASTTTNPRLLTTRWNQYKISTSYGDRFPGCTSVAVGQLINYYFQQGYRVGWLENMLSGITVYPRFETNNWWEPDYRVHTLSNLNIATKSSYLNSITNYSYDRPTNREEYSEEENDLRYFLAYLGIGLDSKFSKDGTGVGRYPAEEPYDWVTDYGAKLRSLLVDRFRFKNTIRSNKLSRLSEEKEYIKNSIDSKKPILIGLFGDDVGHSAIIDNYKIENGAFKVQINFGWGDSSESDGWYDINNAIDLGWIYFDYFYIMKDTLPINYSGGTSHMYGKLKNKKSGKCIDSLYGQGHDNNEIIQYTCSSENNMLWKLEPIQSDYIRIRQKKSDKCLNAKENYNFGKVYLNTCSNNDSFKWKILQAGNGYLKLFSKSTSKCLDVQYGSMDDWSNIIIYSCSSDDNMKWKLSLD